MIYIWEGQVRWICPSQFNLSHERTVKMKLGKLAGNEFGISLSNLMKLKGLSIGTQFKLKRLAKTIGTEVDDYNSIRKTVIEEFGDKDEKGNLIIKLVGNQEIVQIPPANLKNANKKLDELACREFDVPEINVSELGRAAEALTPDDLFNLEFLTDGTEG